MPLFGPNTTRVSLEHFRLTSTLVFYHDSDNYFDDIDSTGAAALHAVDELTLDTGKPALVLDIDETSLLNDWPRLIRAGTAGSAGENPFRYDPKVWNEWIQKACAPACKSTLLIYQHAIDRGLAVFFITGRPESQREVTELNLKRVGFTKWAKVVMRPEPPRDPFHTAEEYKTDARQKIANDEYNILLNIGDQNSDLHGPNSGRVFKYPNPFYFVA